MKKKRLLSFRGHVWKRFSNSCRATLLRLKYKTNDDETQNSSQTLVKSSDIFLIFLKSVERPACILCSFKETVTLLV